jgi:hypothetical protein
MNATKLDVSQQGQYVKVLDVVEIDGKLYDENLNEVSLSDKPVSHTDPLYGVTFSEKASYENYYGTYRVLKILAEQDRMLVVYDSVKSGGVSVGEEKTYPISAQAETIWRQEQKQKEKMRRVKAVDFSGDKEASLFALIRDTGMIQASVPVKSKKSFETLYRTATGEDVSKHFDSEAYYEVKNEDWWGVSLRVYFPLSREDLARFDLPKEGLLVNGNMVRISNNAFVWGLIFGGLRLGRNSQVSDARIAA